MINRNKAILAKRNFKIVSLLKTDFRGTAGRGELVFVRSAAQRNFPGGKCSSFLPSFRGDRFILRARARAALPSRSADHATQLVPGAREKLLRNRR